ncbi:hypothetical protein Glove_193g34 [Diversispora epigaea]|uniref:Uncharacterized protein n=1 Tax=Diversispora epigaea TaxID=1348612 RepID=A0A397ILL2_9GLOM|nr:hypothetical protein Glove_193g34 [Diversispora epigaea]
MPQEQKKIFRKLSRKLRGNLNKRNRKQQQEQQQQQQQQEDNIIFNPSQHRCQTASNEATGDRLKYYQKNLWKSISLNPSNKISTKIQNKIPLYNLLAGFLIREFTKNYLLKLSDIPLDYFQLIISIKDDVDKDNAIWSKIAKWFSKKNKVPRHIEKGKLQKVLKKKWDNLFEDDSFKIKMTKSQKEELINSAKQNNRLAKNENIYYFDNPGCIVDQNDQTLIHLEKINDSDALLKATKAVNEYYFHLVDENNASHRSEKFCQNFIEHFGAYRLYTNLPYTSLHTANNYSNIDYHWDKNDASNCLCCLVPLGDFQGGELYFPQLRTLVPF